MKRFQLGATAAKQVTCTNQGEGLQSISHWVLEDNHVFITTRTRVGEICGKHVMYNLRRIKENPENHGTSIDQKNHETRKNRNEIYF